MKKTAYLLAGLVLAIASTTATAGIITFTDSVKSGAAQHMTIDGDKFLLRNNKLGEYDTDAKRYKAKLKSNATGDNWTLKLNIDNISSVFAPGHSPRCPQAQPGCDTSGWLHFEQDANQRSVLTKKGGLERYVLDLGWGQYGYNAGGVLVAANDGFAAGYWIKEWVLETRADKSLDWNAVSKGGGGDINVYQSVSEPATLGLLGLGVLALIRRRRASYNR